MPRQFSGLVFRKIFVVLLIGYCSSSNHIFRFEVAGFLQPAAKICKENSKMCSYHNENL